MSRDSPFGQQGNLCFPKYTNIAKGFKQRGPGSQWDRMPDSTVYTWEAVVVQAQPKQVELVNPCVETIGDPFWKVKTNRTGFLSFNQIFKVCWLQCAKFHKWALLKLNPSLDQQRIQRGISFSEDEIQCKEIWLDPLTSIWRTAKETSYQCVPIPPAEKKEPAWALYMQPCLPWGFCGTPHHGSKAISGSLACSWAPFPLTVGDLIQAWGEALCLVLVHLFMLGFVDITERPALF